MALDWPDDQRTLQLAEFCGQDIDLLRAVNHMLELDSRAGPVFATQPPLPVARAVDAERPTRIGAYRIMELIGRGGMGEVFRGERDDGLFEQQVAIKLIWPGLSANDAGLWFNAERQILARLSHRNIAQLFDGGVDASGRAYIVMELVVGRSIEVFARESNLGTRERLQLFLQACRAVQYAHENLIVHADLKPSNIVVTHDGTVKLLDFGIARLVDSERQSALPVPASGTGPAAPLTRAYSSPERKSGALPVISDDVFALGVILRELLTGDAPTNDATRAMPAPAGQSTASAASAADAIRIAVTSLPPEMRAIVSKASHARRSERYNSAQALKDDIERYLRGFPVTAVAARWPYRARKFFGRHRLGVTLATLLGTTIIVAATTTTTLYVRAERARKEADRRFDEVRQLARFNLFDVYDRLDQVPRSLALRRDVAAVGQRYLDRLAGDSHAPVSVMLDTIDGLLRLAMVQSRPGSANLGQVPQARANLAKVDLLARELRATGTDLARLRSLRGRSGIEQTRIASYVDNDFAVADRWLSAARTELDALAPLQFSQADKKILELDWQLQLADLRQWQGRYADSVAAARAVLTRSQNLAASERQTRDVLLREARAWDVLAESIYYGGSPAAAEAGYTHRVAILEQAQARFPGDVRIERELPKARWALATTFEQLNRNAEALQLLQRALREIAALRAFEPADQDLIRQQNLLESALAQALVGLHRYKEALPILRTALAERRKDWLDHPNDSTARDYAVGLTRLADAEDDSGNTAAACSIYRAASDEFETLRQEKRLSQLDIDYNLRLMSERRAKHCRK